MKMIRSSSVLLVLLISGIAMPAFAAQVYINEVLFDPPNADSPNEYIELRGKPNKVLSDDVYFVTVDGDNSDAGKIRNVFPLGGYRLGNNGFLVLLQRSNVFLVNTNAPLLQNTGTDPGWGDEDGSSLGHDGRNGNTNLSDPNITFLIIRSSVLPLASDEVDTNHDGWLDGVATNWTILDSVTILNDNTNATNFGYGNLAFRNNSGTSTNKYGTNVAVSFTANYVGRNQNTTGSASSDWVASGGLGGAPSTNYVLPTSTNSVYPQALAGALLNHIGLPNFGGPAIPGVKLVESGGQTAGTEGLTNLDTYTLELTVAPSNTVTIQVQADSQVLVGTNGVTGFTNVCTVVLATNNALRTIYVKVVDDTSVECSNHIGLITHAITATGDAVNYPTNSIIPEVLVKITDNDGLLISEVFVDPPGKDVPDAPREFIELRGAAGALLTNVYLASLDGTGDKKGKVNYCAGLNGVPLGSNGLLLLAATNHPYSPSPLTTVVLDPLFNTTNEDGALGNETLSLLLLTSPTPLTNGLDLDPTDSGILQLPAGAKLLDAVGWTNNGAGDVVYGGVILPRLGITPDAASRLQSNTNASSGAAWFYGDILTNEFSNVLRYSSTNLSANAPTNAALTPGAVNNIPPALVTPSSWSGVTGDPSNPSLRITYSDSETPTASLTLSVISGNPSALPQSRIATTASNGTAIVTITPTNLCYDVPLYVTASDGTNTTTNIVHYAASTGWQTNTWFHIGMGDASAAIAVDSQFMLVGDDEHCPIKLYSRTNSGLPIKEFDFTSSLGLTNYESDGTLSEVDTEASTRFGDRIYWMGSLGNTSDGVPAPSRNRLYATRISGSGTNVTLTYVGRYDRLRDDILDWDARGLHGKGPGYYGLAAGAAEMHPPKSIDGFVFEGLSMVSNTDSNRAYLGFRGPLVPRGDRRKALLLEVTNLAELVNANPSAGPAKFGQTVELDLRGRGIRSIERGSNGFLIVTGLPGAASEDPYEFRLFTWSGSPYQAPEMREVKLDHMRPEAIVEVPNAPFSDTTQVQILSDNGFSQLYLPETDLNTKSLPYPNFKKFRGDWVTLGDTVPLHQAVNANSAARGGRFVRGSGTNAAYHSFVVPLNQQDGVVLDAVQGNATNYFPNNDWTNTLQHYNATNPGSPLSFANPIVAFGTMSGGTPIYSFQNYRLKVGFGDRPGQTAETNLPTFKIWAYDRSTMAKAGEIAISIPLPASGDNGTFTRSGVTQDDPYFGLSTTILPAADASAPQTAFYVSHTGRKTEYVFVVLGLGYVGAAGGGTNARPTLVTQNGQPFWSPLYVLNFDQLPPWRSTFINQPHFGGEPLPPIYAGKSVEELMRYSFPITNMIAPPQPGSYTNLDQSPELRRHPVLDLFVADMGNDPLALANYVCNEIELTDALSYSESTNGAAQSVSPGGVNRSALATFLEGQGSPVEQCALLVYLLRQARTPAVYVYGPANGVKLIDSRLSQLLRMQVKGATTDQGLANVPQLIPVNYPWVAAYVGTNWIHLFPWLKDTEIKEGLNLYDHLPEQFNSGSKWAKAYLLLNTNIMMLANKTDTPSELFPKFLRRSLLDHYPGVSVDDIGVTLVNRRHYYARWQDFPGPTWLTNTATVVESLATITNAFASLTNLFDTVAFEVYSVTNPGKRIATGDLRTADLHNRQFLLWYQETNSNHNMVLSLAPYRPDTTNPVSFASLASGNSSNILFNVRDSVLLNSTDDTLTLKITHKRHQALPSGYATNTPAHYDSFLGFSKTTPFSLVNETTQERTLRKGDLVALCLNLGRVSVAMLDSHRQRYAPIQALVRTNSAAATNLSPETYKGALCNLLGLSYFEKVNRFRELNQRLHKANTVSWYSVGLAQLGAKRDASGQLLAGPLSFVKPRLDICYQQVAFAGNGTLHPDAEYDLDRATTDFYEIMMLDAAAEEHAILNSFFGRTNAISTTRLLQMSRLQGPATDPALLVLTANNFGNYGTNYYGTGANRKQLKDFDPQIWATITSVFTSPSFSNLAKVFISPGAITNDVGVHLGALVLAGRYYAALLSPNLNGAEGEPVDNDSGPAMSGTAELMVLYLGNDGEYHELDWFGHDLYGGGKYMVLSDRVDGYSLPPSIFVSAGMAPIFKDLTGSELVEVLLTLGILRKEASTAYYEIPNETSTHNIVTIQQDKGNTGDPNASQGFWQFLADPVNAVTGEFYVHETDLVLNGPWPLPISRTYGSKNHAENELGYGWKLNFFAYLVVTPSNTLIYAAEPDGAVIAYRKQTNDVWIPTLADNPQLVNANQAGQRISGNLLTARIARTNSASVTNYVWYGPDGSVRTYAVRAFPLDGIQRERPYLEQWTDTRGNFYRFQFGTNSTAADYGKLRRIEGGSGNSVVFYYDALGHIRELVAKDGRRVQYDYSDWDDLIRVTRPDASEIGYDYLFVPLTNALQTNFLYGWITSPGPKGGYTVQAGIVGTNAVATLISSHLVVRERKPDGRILRNVYDDHGRVTAQWATAGLDLNPVQNATFIYSNNAASTNHYTNGITGFTLVLDVFGRTNRYEYTNNFITNVVDALGRRTVRQWYWASDAAGGYQHSLKSETDARGLTRTYFYDDRGNVISNVISGLDLTGDGQTNAVSRFTYSTNLLVNTTDPLGNQTVFVPDPVYRSLPQYTFSIASNGVAISSNYHLYTAVTDVTSSATNVSFGLLRMSIAAMGSPEASSNAFLYNGQGFLEQSIRYTGTTDPPVTNTLFYNGRGELVEQIDAAGRRQRFAYDGMGRPTGREVYEAGLTTPLAWDYSYYTPNGELAWTDGPRFDPEDYVWRDYDGAGRQIQEIRWRSRAREDGSGVEAETGDALFATTFYEHDLFGNLTKITDPRGVVTLQTFDAAGQLVSRTILETNGSILTSEGFGYEPGGALSFVTNALGAVTERQYTSGGKLKWQRNPDGSMNTWRFDLNGRTRRATQPNGAYWETTYEDANRKTTRVFYTADSVPLTTNVTKVDRRGNVLRTTDAAGFVFTNLYDGLGRVRVAAGPAVTSMPPTNAPPAPGGSGSATTNQQVTAYSYDGSGVVTTVTNALGEKTVTVQDALGRILSVEVFAAGSSIPLRVTEFDYATNHHSTTVWQGSGASAIPTTTYTDNDGHDVLTVTYPTNGVWEYSWTASDSAGNVIESRRYSRTNSTLSLWATNSWSHDGLHRVVRESSRDGATTVFGYDLLGNLTTRSMPDGLTWTATYTGDGRISTEQDSGGGETARSTSYTYYPTNHVWAGLLKTITDGRGVVRTNAYDDFLRIASVTTSGSDSNQQMTSNWAYDRRGLLTNVTQSFANTNTGLSTSVRWSHDAYGRIASEMVTVGGGLSSSVGQSWNSAGRRSVLSVSGAPASADFGYRADGLMTKAGDATFGYADTGLLTGRTNSQRAMTVTARDSSGRRRQTVTRVDNSNILTETLSWRGDGLLTDYTASRNDFTDTRHYAYAPWSQRLTEESLYLGASQPLTNFYTYDHGQSARLGVLTSTRQSSAQLPGQWGVPASGGLDGLKRMVQETNTMVRRIARGQVNGPATLRGTLNSRFVALRNDSSKAGQWTADLELATGTNTLTVYADHPSGQFTTNAISTFTLTNKAADTLAATFDGNGNVTQRVWKNYLGQTNRTQTLTWDAFNRLVKVTERDVQSHGYNWQATFDGLGRRARTLITLVSNSVATVTNTIVHHYDPQVEFLEIGVSVNGVTVWKLYGPDADGQYGSLQGLGGLELLVAGTGPSAGIIQDHFGNVIAGVNSGTVQWVSARSSSYGPVEGTQLPTLTVASLTADHLAWRGKWRDVAGDYYWGARPYDARRRAFIGFDPYGHTAGTLDGFGFANCDPVNYFDPDARLGKQALDLAKTGLDFGGNAVIGFGEVFTGYDPGVPGSQIAYNGRVWGRSTGASISTWLTVAGAADTGTGIGTMTLSAASVPATAGLDAPAAAPAFAAGLQMTVKGAIETGVGVWGLYNYNKLTPVESPQAGGTPNTGSGSSANSGSTSSSGPQLLGKVDPPSGLTPGTTPFGNQMHERIAQWLQDRYPEVQFEIRVKPGQNGVDVTVLGDGASITGFKYGEIKPRNIRQQGKFDSQVDNWGFQRGQVKPITYDYMGNIFDGF